MRPLKSKVVEKPPNFSKEIIHIRDNCYVLIDSKYITIVLEHGNSLECHGISRAALRWYTLSQLLNQPVMCVMDEDMVNIMKGTVNSMTIGESRCCRELRSICKVFDGNHYIHKLYNGNNASVYGFMYSVHGGQTVVCLQSVNYGAMNMEGSFSVDRDIVESIYNLIKEK